MPVQEQSQEQSLVALQAPQDARQQDKVDTVPKVAMATAALPYNPAAYISKVAVTMTRTAAASILLGIIHTQARLCFRPPQLSVITSHTNIYLDKPSKNPATAPGFLLGGLTGGAFAATLLPSISAYKFS